MAKRLLILSNMERKTETGNWDKQIFAGFGLDKFCLGSGTYKACLTRNPRRSGLSL